MQRTSFAQPRSDFEWDYDGRKAPTNSAFANNTQTTSDTFLSDMEECNYDRRELRRRLSLDSDHEDELNSQFAMRVKRSNLRERLQQRMNLQICFVDNGEDDDQASDSDRYTADDTEIAMTDEQNHDSLGNISCNSLNMYDSFSSTQSKASHTLNPKGRSDKGSSVASSADCETVKSTDVKDTKVNPQSNTQSFLDSSNRLLSKFKPLFTFAPFSNFNLSSDKQSPSHQITEINDTHFATFEEYHRHIHDEAKKALKAAREMAQMQMQLEKDQSKSNPTSGVANDNKANSTPINLKLDANRLLKASKSQIEGFIDEINAKTTELNLSLVKLLEERDELNMEQDSLLIDIEDLTRFFLSQNR